MTVSMDVTQKVSMSVVFTDAKGNVVPALGIPVWTCPDAAGVLTAAADGISAEYVAITIGTDVVTVTGDGVSGILTIVVSAAPAVTATITAAAPVLQ